MASTDFTDGVTLSAAAWFDDVNTLTYSYLTSPAGTNTITAAGPATMTLATGLVVRFIPANTNTGATTVDVYTAFVRQETSTPNFAYYILRDLAKAMRAEGMTSMADFRELRGKRVPFPKI